MIEELSLKRAGLGKTPGERARAGVFGGEDPDAFQKALEGDDDYVRRLAVTALEAVGRPGAALSDLRVETNYIQKLAKAGHVNVDEGLAGVEELISTLGDDSQSKRAEAMLSLANMGFPSIKPLISALKSKDHQVRAGSTLSLGMMGGPAVDPLIDVLKSEIWDLRRNAAKALGWIGDERAVPHLTALLKDENPFVRLEAADALATIGGSHAKAALKSSEKKLFESGFIKKLFSRHKLF